MSAFVVSDKTIAGMLQATRLGLVAQSGISVYWNGISKQIHSYDSEIAAQTLIDENYRSVNHRYNERDESHVYSMASIGRLEAVQIIKLCNCYAYQACETDDWEETEAYAICNALKETAVRNLPGYEDAEWEL